MDLMLWLLTYIPFALLVIYIEKKFKLKLRLQKRFRSIKNIPVILILLIIIAAMIYIIEALISDLMNLNMNQNKMLEGFFSALIIGFIIIIVPFQEKKQK